MDVGVPRVIDLRVLGPLDVRSEGQPVAVPGSKPRSLLIMLGLNAGRVVAGDYLRALLWGDDIPRTVHKALQTHISTLRRVLGEDAILTRGAGWSLAVATTDAVAFDAASRAGRHALEEGDLPDAVARLTEALELWRGVPELPETPRGEAETIRWAETREAVADDRADALLASGYAAELIGELEAAVAESPLREHRWAQLCLALYRAGRQADALGAYQRARAVLIDELGVEPGPDLRRLETAMLAHDEELDVTMVRTATARPAVTQALAGHGSLSSLSPRTTFVGRREELARLDQLLRRHRLVTVVGPGGAGKTRLAISAIDGASAPFPGGVYIVDLATCEDLMVEAVAAAMGIVEQPGRPLERAIYESLGTRSAILFLDNCDRLVEEVCSFADQLIAACPHVVVLATSRERLGAPGERVFSVPPLSMVGADSGGPKGSDAETLFLDRARSVDPDFNADPDLIAEVCARCDGLPLAIELAAARGPSLGIDGLLAGLDDRMRLLVGARGAAGRHRSLRAVLDWSHDLLGPAEQAVFRRLGIFAGGFDLPAIAEVAGDHMASSSDLIDVVGRLTDKHLLSHDNGPARSRWRMLEVVRSYARDQLVTCGEYPTVWERYLRWASASAAELGHRLDAGEPWREEFDASSADLRAALSGADIDVAAAHETGSAPVGETREQRLTLATSLARLDARRGAFTLAQSAYEEVVSMARATGDANQLASAALGASMAGMLFGVTQPGRVALLEEALSMHGTEATGTRARLLARLATELYWSADRKRSLDLADDAVAVAGEAGDDGARAHALYARLYVSRSPHNTVERLELAEEIMTLSQRAGESQLELAGLAAQVVGQLELGELVAMDADVTELSDAARRLHHPEFQWYAAVYRLVRALLAGRFDEADQLVSDTMASGRHVPEFSVDLFFAEAITDLRTLDESGLRHRGQRLAEMARRYPGVVVWRCLAVLDEVAVGRRRAAGEHVRALVKMLVDQPLRDGHWLVAGCLLAEAVVRLPDTGLAPTLDAALRPYRESFAVAGRVAAFRGAVSHATGLLSLAAGNTDQAVADLELAARRHRQMEANPFLIRTLGALATAYETRAEPNDDVLATAVRQQMTEMAERCHPTGSQVCP
ncbi:BTAD domain-containing putative transcriptional regulator [Phytoactinopolyspora mesophila]